MTAAQPAAVTPQAGEVVGVFARGTGGSVVARCGVRVLIDNEREPCRGNALLATSGDEEMGAVCMLEGKRKFRLTWVDVDRFRSQQNTQ